MWLRLIDLDITSNWLIAKLAEVCLLVSIKTKKFSNCSIFHFSLNIFNKSCQLISLIRRSKGRVKRFVELNLLSEQTRIVNQTMSAENFIKIRKLTQLFAGFLVLMLCLCPSTDGRQMRRITRKPPQQTEPSGRYWCPDMQWACVNEIGKPLGYMCVIKRLTWELHCKDEFKKDQLLANCTKIYPESKNVVQTVLKCN